MKIRRIMQPETARQTLEQFADSHNLTMEVHERPKEYKHLPRFYAHFEHAEVKNGSILHGTYGDGDTEEEAIREYARSISGRLLIINATSKNRTEIKVPVLEVQS